MQIETVMSLKLNLIYLNKYHYYLLSLRSIFLIFNMDAFHK
jgi:hypothetical protein